MEVVDDPSKAGCLIVLLNGTQRFCQNTFDCPGACLCATNRTWMADWSRGVCMSNSKFGYTGANCDQWCTHAVILLIINVLAVSVALGLFITVAYLFSNIAREQPIRGILRSPVAVTLTFVGIGSMFFIVAPIMSIVNELAFPQTSILIQLTPGTPWLRRPSQSLEYANHIAFGIAFCISVCAFVILPLTWIDVSLQQSFYENELTVEQIARTTLRLRPARTKQVIGLTIVIVVVILAIQLPFYILSARRYSEDAPTWILGVAISWAVIFPFVILLNILARRELGAVTMSASQPDVKQFFWRMRISAWQIIVSSVGGLAFLSFSRAKYARGYTSDPRCYVDPIDICFRLAMFFVLYGCIVATWFVAPSALQVAAVVAEQSVAEQSQGSRRYVEIQRLQTDATGSGDAKADDPVFEAKGQSTQATLVGEETNQIATA